MAIVLRVELGFSTLDNNSKGNCISTKQGPYTTYQSWMSVNNGYLPWDFGRTNIDHQPEPHQDGLEKRFGVIYGFKDIYQLFWWFESDILSLTESGFMISTYEVPDEDVEYGKRQVQFCPGEAKLLDMVNLREAVREVYFNDDFMEKLQPYFKC